MGGERGRTLFESPPWRGGGGLWRSLREVNGLEDREFNCIRNCRCKSCLWCYLTQFSGRHLTVGRTRVIINNLCVCLSPGLSSPLTTSQSKDFNFNYIFYSRNWWSLGEPFMLKWEKSKENNLKSFNKLQFLVFSCNLIRIRTSATFRYQTIGV